MIWYMKPGFYDSNWYTETHHPRFITYWSLQPFWRNLFLHGRLDITLYMHPEHLVDFNVSSRRGRTPNVARGKSFLNKKCTRQ